MPGRVLEVAGLFLKLGFTGFGGTAANIALMEQETVEKRRWLTREHFLDLLAVTNLVRARMQWRWPAPLGLSVLDGWGCWPGGCASSSRPFR